MKILFAALFAATCAHAQTYNITQGGSYLLVSHNSDPKGACVVINTTEPVTISGWFWTAGNGIYCITPNANLTVVRAAFFATSPGFNETGTAIITANAQSLIVRNCQMTGFLRGVWTASPRGPNPVIWIAQNQINNPSGWDCGGIQLVNCVGITGIIWANDIEHNLSVGSGDNISLFNVQGLPSRHFSVQGNLVNGSIVFDPDREEFNAAITTDGVFGTGQVCQYIDIDDNTVVHATMGINLAYGQNNEASGNRVISDNILDNGEPYQFFATGMAVAKGSPSDVISNNQVAVNGADYFNSGTGTFKNNTSLFPGRAVTAADEQWAIDQWNNANAAFGITIGPFQ